MAKKGKVNRRRSPEVAVFIMMHRIKIAKNLKLARKAKGITQAVLADRCKINVRTIGKYENNECAVPSGDLILIILVLGTTLSKIAEIEGI